MIPGPGKTEQDSTRLHTATQSSVKCKAYDLFISRFSHLLILDHNQLQTNKHTEVETTGKQTTAPSEALSHHIFAYLLQPLLLDFDPRDWAVSGSSPSPKDE